jgi:hypothetical protein
MGYYCPIIGRFCDPNNEKPCEFFEKPFGRKITNGDKIIAGGNKGIAIFACGLLNDRREETFQKVLSFLTAPVESDVCVAQNGDHDTQTDLCCNDDTQDQEGKDE